MSVVATYHLKHSCGHARPFCRPCTNSFKVTTCGPVDCDVEPPSVICLKPVRDPPMLVCGDAARTGPELLYATFALTDCDCAAPPAVVPLLRTTAYAGVLGDNVIVWESEMFAWNGGCDDPPDAMWAPVRYARLTYILRPNTLQSVNGGLCYYGELSLRAFAAADCVGGELLAANASSAVAGLDVVTDPIDAITPFSGWFPPQYSGSCMVSEFFDFALPLCGFASAFTIKSYPGSYVTIRIQETP